MGKTLDLNTEIPGVISQFNPRAKRYRLRLDRRQNRIVLVIPKGGSQAEGWDFAHQNRAWIDQTLASLPATKRWQDGDTLPVLGQTWTLREDASANRLSPRDGVLRIPSEAREDRQLRLRRLLIAEARRALPPMIEAGHARLQKLDLTPAPIQLKRIRLSAAGTRWGSCSARGTVSLNWRLVLSPASVAAYVAAHEVAHLAHMDHSPAFWALNERLHQGDMTADRHWLKQNGGTLLSLWP